MKESASEYGWDNMRLGILSQIEEIKLSPYQIFEQLEKLLKDQALPSRIYLVGCGDSWVSGICTQIAFEAWAGIPAEAVESLEFSHYRSPYLDPHAWVCATSISGRVKSTVEAVKTAQAKGLLTIAGTANSESPLASVSPFTLFFDYKEKSFGPGTISYHHSLLFHYCLALYLAKQNHRMTTEQVSHKLSKIASLSINLQATFDANNHILEKLGRETDLNKLTIFVGGGPNYGTACYSMIKVIETTRTPARAQQLEEWAHQDYFLTSPGSLTFVIAPPDGSVERAREQLRAASLFESQTIAICSDHDNITKSLASFALPIVGEVDDLLTPLVYCLPGQIFAYYYAIPKNLTMLGYDNPKIRSINQQQIYINS